MTLIRQTNMAVVSGRWRENGRRDFDGGHSSPCFCTRKRRRDGEGGKDVRVQVRFVRVRSGGAGRRGIFFFPREEEYDDDGETVR